MQRASEPLLVKAEPFSCPLSNRICCECLLSTHCGQSTAGPTCHAYEDSPPYPRHSRIAHGPAVDRAGHGQDSLAGIELHDRSAALRASRRDPRLRWSRPDPGVAEALASARDLAEFQPFLDRPEAHRREIAQIMLRDPPRLAIALAGQDRGGALHIA